MHLFKYAGFVFVIVLSHFCYHHALAQSSAQNHGKKNGAMKLGLKEGFSFIADIDSTNSVLKSPRRADDFCF